MARNLADIASPGTIGIAVLGLFGFAGVALAFRSQRGKKLNVEQLEARRRAWLALHGKLAGGEILEVHENSLSYLYDVRGMAYTASQDVSALQDHLPLDRWSIVGGVGVRYDPRNPANSIVISETWTGLRQSDHKAS